MSMVAHRTDDLEFAPVTLLVAPVCAVMDTYLSKMARQVTQLDAKDTSIALTVFLHDLAQANQRGTFNEDGRDVHNLVSSARIFYNALPATEKLTLQPMFIEIAHAVKQARTAAKGTPEQAKIETEAAKVLQSMAGLTISREKE